MLTRSILARSEHPIWRSPRLGPETSPSRICGKTMANAYLTLVWSATAVQLTHAELLILLRFADRANDDGVAYPGIQSVARDCRLSETHVSRTINRLAKRGLLTQLKKARPGRARVFQLERDVLAAASAKSTLARNTDPVAPREESACGTRTNGCASRKRTIINHHGEPSEEPSVRRAYARRDQESNELGEIYLSEWSDTDSDGQSRLNGRGEDDSKASAGNLERSDGDRLALDNDEDEPNWAAGF